MRPIYILLAVFGFLVAYGMFSFTQAGYHLRAVRKTSLPFLKYPKEAMMEILISGGATFKRHLIRGVVTTLLAFISLMVILIYVLVTHR